MKINTEKLNTVSPYLYMQFMEPLGTADSSVDAAWDYLHECWRPELINLVKSLGPGMVRWGGCFASYYRWKEAVGPMEQRVPMLNQCWDGLYYNHVGTKEIVEFCKRVNAEPLLVVNMESDGRMNWAYPRRGECRFADAKEATEWVRYCNDPDDALRISHGSKEPFGVKYWQIGNETSYDPRGYHLEDAYRATVDFASEMRKADPGIKLIAWGDDGWAPKMAETDADMIAFHHHFGSGLDDSPLYGTEYRKDPAKTWTHMMNAHVSLAEHIAKVRAELKGSNKRIAVTEGHFALPGRNRCEVLSSWMTGCAYARCLNEYMRASDIIDIATMADFFGNRWQVNAILIPTPVRKQPPYLQPVGQVMRLYGHHVGTHQIRIDAPEGVDAVATRDESRIYVHVMNTSAENAVKLPIEIDGMPVKAIRAWEIAPEDPTVEVTELIPNVFDPVEKSVDGNVYTLPAAAVAALEIEV